VAARAATTRAAAFLAAGAAANVAVAACAAVTAVTAVTLTTTAGAATVTCGVAAVTRLNCFVCAAVALELPTATATADPRLQSMLQLCREPALVVHL